MNLNVFIIPTVIFLVIVLIWYILWQLIKGYAREQVLIRDILEKNKALITIYKAYKVKPYVIDTLESETRSLNAMMDRYNKKPILRILKPFINDSLPESMKKGKK